MFFFEKYTAKSFKLIFEKLIYIFWLNEKKEKGFASTIFCYELKF